LDSCVTGRRKDDESKSEEDKAKEVINKAKVEDDEYHKNANEEQTYYRWVFGPIGS
jgi:hypothetical protein